MATPRTPFVSTAEAAFLAGLDTTAINRVVDDKLVPSQLLEQEPGSRRVARLAAALARVYFELEDTLAPRARREIVEELSTRVHKLGLRDRTNALCLRDVYHVSWVIALPSVTVDVTPQVAEAASKAEQVDLADMLVTTHPDVMSGAPCFAGTRVPIETVLASLDEGVSLERLKASYPFVTEAHVDAARVYLLVHPRRGRPRRLVDTKPSLKPRSSKLVRPASR